MLALFDPTRYFLGMALTVSQIADYAGISPTTIRVWGKELAQVLSNGANPKQGLSRHYTSEDAGIFHTAKILKSEGKEWEQIIEAVEAGDRILPTGNQPASENAGTNDPLPHEPITQPTDMIPASLFDKLIANVNSERDRLVSELDSERTARLDAVERAVKAETMATMLQAQLDEMSQPAPATSPTAGTNKPRRWWHIFKK